MFNRIKKLLPQESVRSYFTNNVTSLIEVLVPLKDYLVSRAFYVARGIEYFILGDLRHIIENDKFITERAAEDKKGIGVARIGPPLIGYNIAFIQSKLESSEIPRQLKAIIDLKEPKARSPMDLINLLTGANLIIANNTPDAIPLRKILSRYFKPKVIYEQFFQHLSSSMINAPDRLGVEDYLKFSIIHIRHVLATAFFGIEPNEEMQFMLGKVKNAKLAVAAFLPRIIQQMHPSVRKIRVEFDEKIRRFLFEKIKCLSQSAKQQTPQQGETLFVDTLLRHSPKGKSLGELTDREITQMTDIPDIRSCLVGWLAADSLRHAIFEGVYEFLMRGRNSVFLEKLCQEIYSQLQTTTNLRTMAKHKESMPLLHAFYMETLRISAFPDIIRRYTESGIQKDSLSIPPRSFIGFDLEKVMRTPSSRDDFPPESFSPERYLSNDDKLLPTAELHQGTLLPFGAGIRQCPASIIVEDYFKNFIILTAVYYSSARDYILSSVSPVVTTARVSSAGLFSNTPTSFDSKAVTRYLDKKARML